MKLKLTRTFKAKTYTIGKLYINDVYFCDTLEDTDRGLKKSTPLSEIEKIKIKHQTCIPEGTYTILMNIVSPKYGKIMPRLKDVPGFEGILIHNGNTDVDTSGCILVGKNSEVGKVLTSKWYFNDPKNPTNLFSQLEKAAKDKEEITITIS